MAYTCAQRLASRGEWVPDLAMAGGLSTEDHIFKVLAMGAPYFKWRDFLREHQVHVFSSNYAVYGDTIRFGAMGFGGRWQMQQKWKSPAFTTRWNELPVVRAS